MKVVITDAKRADYDALFEELAAASQQTVDSLPTYYAALKHMIDNQNIPLNKFYRIPLEEPYFEVDMNARSIKVPEIFSNYGLGVTGDANAEMVFFEVERFFDGVDLYALVQENQQEGVVTGAWVQWKNVTTGTTGNSKIIFHDAADTVRKDAAGNETRTEVMYLGWVITKEMTAEAGNLEFSLRFFKVDDGKITYSISTQKATCPIKATLNLAVLNAEAEDMADIVYKRPLYSGVINSMNGASARVIENLDNSHTYDLNVLDSAELTAALAELPAAAKNDSLGHVRNFENGIYVFTVEAESPDGGTIIYQWYNGASSIAGATAAEYAANIAGTYSVRIGNDKAGVGTRWSVSPSVVIPAAQAIAFSANHSWPIGMYSNGTNSLHVDVCDKASKGAPNGELRYTWTKKELAFVDGKTVVASGNGTVIPTATEATYTPAVDEEGAYVCSIVNYRNNTTSDPIATEKQAIVRAEPDVPSSVTISFNDSAKTLTVSEVAFPANSKSQNHSDEWFYQWSSNIQGQISAANGGTNRTYNISNLPENTDNSTDYIFKCEVRHVVWNDNVGGERMAGSTRESNSIRIHIKGTGASKIFTVITD